MHVRAAPIGSDIIAGKLEIVAPQLFVGVPEREARTRRYPGGIEGRYSNKISSINFKDGRTTVRALAPFPPRGSYRRPIRASPQTRRSTELSLSSNQIVAPIEIQRGGRGGRGNARGSSLGRI